MKGQVGGYDENGKRGLVKQFMFEHNKTTPSCALEGNVKETYKGQSRPTAMTGGHSS